MSVFFKEVQKLRRTQLMPVYIFITSMVVLVFVITFLQHIEIIPQLLPQRLNFKVFRTTEILSVLLLYLLIPATMMKLEIKISEKDVMYKYTPLFNRKQQVINRADIKEFKLTSAENMKGYHGWSIIRNFGVRKGIFTISGSKGIELNLVSGKKIILGTQKPELFIKALERMKNSKLSENG